MKTLTRALLTIGVALIGVGAWCASVGQDPYIGYVYPAGGKQGTVFRVTVAGQRLRAAGDVYVSGGGVRGTVVSFQGGSGPLSSAQQQELRRRLEEIRAKRGGAPAAKPAPNKTQNAAANDKPIKLPDLPELRDLEQKTPAQLRWIADRFLNNAKRPKAPIAEQVTLEITVDADAAPGDRELRLRTPAGLTNPLVFQVSQISEVREPDKDAEFAPPLGPSQPPVVLNGQIMPGEVDRFQLQLKAGQTLAVDAEARKLIPYLADAVPGWFQAVAALRDSDGREVAYDDDCGFDPDPALAFKAARDGVYTLEIRDSIYRGRQDFVYRVYVTEESKTDGKQPAMLAQAHFLVSTPLNQQSEVEPNDTGLRSVPVKLPRVISGCIGRPGDKDLFRFEGKAGDTVVAEVSARRVGSSLDSLLRLLDAKGRVVAWNDDSKGVNLDMLTHQADSILSAKLPKTGAYYAQVSDPQGHGGPDYYYSLRIGPPQPDFELRLAPSALNVTAGRTVLATVYAIRKDGWSGDIDIALKEAPAGFVLSGGRIPKGRDCVRVTLAAPLGRIARVIKLELEGRAQIGGKTVVRPVVPCDNLMQAFAYQHLVASGELLATVVPGGYRLPTIEVAGSTPLRLRAGGRSEVKVSMRPSLPNTQIKLELTDPPDGLILKEVKATPDGFTLVLDADKKLAGYSDNLIIGAFTDLNMTPQNPDAPKQRVSIGALPAVAYEVTK